LELGEIMMVILGYFVLVFFSIMLTFAWMVQAFDGLGAYNIGGVPNSLTKKFVILCFFALLVLLWIFVYEVKPFTVFVYL
jgi:hypothetical protein